MEDFFKQFRDNLERRPQPAFEERDWQGLEKRLDQQGEKRPAGLAWWWLAWPLLLLSLGANVLLYSELKATRQQIAAPETRRDTVFLTQTIFRTDTIYQTSTVRSVQLFPPRLVFSPSTTDVHDKIETPSQATHLVKTPSAANNQNQLLKNSPTASEILPCSILSPLPSTVRRQPGTVSEIPVEPTVSKHKKTLQQHLYVMRPKGFRLGIVGGWAYPFSKGLESPGGYSAGLEANIEFSPNLRMWAGATYSKVGFVADRMDAAIGIPPVAPPSDDFVFVEAEAPQPSFEYGVGMQYLFNVSRKFKPFLGVGYGAVSLLPYEVAYDFENQLLDIEWSFEKNVSRSEFLANLLLLRAGFEYEMSKKWHWQVRATYRNQLGETGFQTPDVLGIQVGLMRRF